MMLLITMPAHISRRILAEANAASAPRFRRQAESLVPASYIYQERCHARYNGREVAVIESSFRLYRPKNAFFVRLKFLLSCAPMILDFGALFSLDRYVTRARRFTGAD